MIQLPEKASSDSNDYQLMRLLGRTLPLWIDSLNATFILPKCADPQARVSIMLSVS